MAELITNQNEPRFKKIKYGIFPVSFNGCGIIATYNAFILLGLNPPDFIELTKTFWHLGMAILFGLAGNDVYKTHKVLQHYGISYKQVLLGDLLDTEAENDGVYIISVWNKRPPFHGIHTVALQIKNGTPTTYNMYSNIGITTEPLDSLIGTRLIRAYKVYN